MPLASMKKLFKHPLFSGSFLMIGGSLLANAVNYAYHVVMGRVMGPEVYGALASVFSVLYLVNIVPASTSFAVVKFVSDAKSTKEQNQIYSFVKKLFNTIGLWVGLALILASPLINDFLHLENIWEVLLVAPIFYVSLITLPNQSTMQGLLKFMGVVGPNFASAVSKLVFGLIFVFLGWRVGGAVLGVLAGALIGYLYSVAQVKSLVKEVPSTFELKKFVNYALPVLVQALAFTAFFTVDVIFAKHYLSAFDAGLYASLSTLGKIIFFAGQPFTGVMFPIVVGRRAKGEKYRHIFYVTFAATAIVSLLVLIFYDLFPNIAIGVLYGEKYLSAANELVWMGWFMSVYTAAYLLINFVLSLGRTKIVVLPMAMVVVQVLAIALNHGSILTIIQMSLASVSVVLVGVLIYLGYNEAKRYASTY